MKRPTIFFLFFLILGILGRFFIQNNIVVSMYLICCVILAFLICKKCNKQYIISCSLFLALGFVFCSLRMGPRDENAQKIAESGQIATIVGVVTESGYTSSGRRRLVLRTSSLESHSYVANNRLNIVVFTDIEEEILPGTEVLVRGHLISPQPRRNLGGFNEYLHYKARRLDYRTQSNLIEIGATNVRLNTIFHHIRYRISETYDNLLPPIEAGIAKSLVLGDRSDLDDDILNLYRNAGIYHLVAISGLHISVIAAALKRLLLKPLGIRKSLIITTLFIIMYCMFTGAAVATVRATAMLLIATLSFFFMKEYDMKSSVSLTAILLLLYEPFYIFDVGFQLSFGCIFGICYFNEPIYARISSLFRERFTGIAKSLALSLSISVFTLPIFIMHFNRVPLYSSIVNLLIVPVASFAVILAFIIALVGMVFPQIAMFFAATLYYILQYFEFVSRIFSAFPSSQVLIATQPVFISLFYYVGIFSVALKLGTKRFRKIIISSFFVIFFVWNIRPTPFQITMLDVGQGDSFVIEHRNEVIFIDGGGWFDREIGQSTGARVLVPYLDYRGIRNVDVAFITHFDRDHHMGIFELITMKNVRTVIIPTIENLEDEYFQTLVELCKIYNTEMVFFSAGSVLETRGGVTFEVLSPFDNNPLSSDNENSLVLMLQYQEFRMLFTADVGHPMERILIEQGIDLSAHVLKAGHHGSRHSSSIEFLEA
ncbi:MAG: DNA internalization-related competence protein ComEC/Rec2, partial [Defluviitaleaceae bacterium]|nr:DNA internalization-related competence protein ComEC/Rec2 [Defluviitaleaceae bacterium]